MNTFKDSIRAIGLVSLTTVLISCGGSDDTGSGSSGGDGLLAFIPADSPYVFVTQDQMPDDVADKLEPHIDAMLRSYHKVIAAAIRNEIEYGENSEEELESMEALLPFVDELQTLFSVDGLESVGIDRGSRFAFYGNGLLPVMRLTLSDGALLEAEIAKLEASAGSEMESASIDGVTYRYSGDDEWRAMIAIVDNQLVMTSAPTSFDDSQLKSLLGMTPPAQSMADTGTLASISDEYDYEDFMVGMLDFERLTATFLNEPTGLNAALFADEEFDSGYIDDVCKAEVQSLARVAPRFVAGYTDISTDGLRLNSVLELRDDIAESVAGLTGQVPGLGGSFDGLFSFGMSFDIVAIREFYAERLDALEAEPLECELLAEQQAGILAGRELLNQPVPPIVYGFQGFLAEVASMDMTNLQYGMPPTEFDLRMLVATNNAEGLLAMGAMFVPEIAALNLEPGGDPVKVEISQLAAMEQVVYAALSDNAFALSLGDGMQDGLKDMLARDAADASPFLSMDIDAQQYYDLISMRAEFDGGDESTAELEAAIAELMNSTRDLFERLHFDILFTDRGVEFNSETPFAN